MFLATRLRDFYFRKLNERLDYTRSLIILKRTITTLNVNDLIVRRSNESGVAQVSVNVHEFPAFAPSVITPERDAYCFWYRPRIERGDTRVSIPEFGLTHHRISRDDVLIDPAFQTFLRHNADRVSAAAKAFEGFVLENRTNIQNVVQTSYTPRLFG